MLSDNFLRRKSHVKERKNNYSIYFTFFKAKCLYIKLPIASMLFEELKTLPAISFTSFHIFPH